MGICAELDITERKQLEAQFLDPVVNAREAMPQGGQLSISIGNVFLDEAYCRLYPDAVPGEYAFDRIAPADIPRRRRGEGKMTDKLAFMRDELATLKEEKRHINIRTMGSPADGWMIVDGKRVLNFCTNNYLGLANHPALKEAARRAIDEWGVGPAAVRTIAGTQQLHVELERRLAEFKGVEAALFVQSASAPTRRPSPRWWAART